MYCNRVMVLLLYPYFSFNVPYIYIRIPEYHDVSGTYKFLNSYRVLL